eukprot:NODE_2542_length_1173_cov_31.141459_g2323_i0.p1 GENE.NODE_2542_length_1173_cov_31.141459_g2323_i0~~NODE_2542_length_1173_cov_31.141459_g2323_i0.p1  ORF type:complete len:303 (-),score=48.22 NODE_2542_length_1173_cov_31.141459_g2323_i0:263-1120(-)
MGLICRFIVFASLVLLLAVHSGEGLPMNDTAPLVDLKEARVSLHYSWAAYCDARELALWTCPECSKVPRLEHVALLYGQLDTFGFVGRTAGNEVVVAFRGTTDLKNWIENLRTTKARVPFQGAPKDVEAHDGFLSGYLSMKQVLFQELQALCPQHNCTMRVTGHSMGAAVATLALTDIVSDLKWRTKPSLITFGSPRVGNAAFFAWWKGMGLSSVRMTHNDDPVPHVPPESFGFQHVFTEVWQVNSTYKLCDGSGEDKRCADSVPPSRFSIPDHADYLNMPGLCL